MLFGLTIYMWLAAIFMAKRIHVSATVVVKLRGAGGSFAASVYHYWRPLFKSQRLQFVTLNSGYDVIGSGAGKRRIKQETKPEVEYAGSDSLLSEADYEAHPDLQMFPTMAGAVVLAYNLPEVDVTLVLSREVIVGIYNGSYRFWNDTILQELNPNATLPGRQISLLARAGKSGTTELFTTALSSFSSEWKNAYGAFSVGLNNNKQPIKWKPGVISLFGKGNRGMSGVILSIPYTMGYISVSEAKSAGLPYALVKNRAGNVVDAGVVAVQSAMDDFGDAMDSRLTISISDGGGIQSYPMAGYTYMIVQMTDMRDCSSAVELVRYVEWFLTRAEARQGCLDNSMVPLSDGVTRLVRNRVLKELECAGENMWERMEIVLQQEKVAVQTWRIPVIVISPFVILALISALAYSIQQRIKLKKMIDSNEWNVSIEDILFLFPGKKNFQSTVSLQGQSIRSLQDVSDVDNGQDLLSQVLQWPAKLAEHDVGVRLLQLEGFASTAMNTDLKKTLLGFRDVIIHENVVRFYGLTELDNHLFIISDLCSRGPMSDILQDEKFKLTKDFKLSLSFDIANGLAFLHKNNLVHGHVSSACCLIDARWVVRILDWELKKIYRRLHKKYPLAMVHKDNNSASFEQSFRNFWVAPEALSAGFHIEAHSSMDMYSFSIIMQEIFTREDPYAELYHQMNPDEVVKAVLRNNLRPKHHPHTPEGIRQVMEIGWSEDPLSRPTLEQALKLMKNVSPNKKSILDSIIASMEEYTRYLEVRLGEQQMGRNNINKTQPSSSALLENVDYVQREKQGAGFSNVGVLFLSLGDIVSVNIQQSVKAFDITDHLAMISAKIKAITERYGVHMVENTGTAFGFATELSASGTEVEELVALAFQFISALSECKVAGTGDQSLLVSCGMFMGSVLSGAVQPGEADWCVMGQPVDGARLLMQTARPGEVLVCSDIAHLLQNHQEINPIYVGKIAREEDFGFPYYRLGPTSKFSNGQPNADTTLGKKSKTAPSRILKSSKTHMN